MKIKGGTGTNSVAHSTLESTSTSKSWEHGSNMYYRAIMTHCVDTFTQNLEHARGYIVSGILYPCHFITVE